MTVMRRRSLPCIHSEKELCQILADYLDERQDSITKRFVIAAFMELQERDREEARFWRHVARRNAKPDFPDWAELPKGL